MDRFIRSCALLCCIALLLCGCTAPQKENKAADLNGKKVVFIGDSFLFTGRAVLPNTAPDEENRKNDTGYFYQLCKANGMEVAVSNWTFGGKGLDAIMNQCITDYTDFDYDYVILSGGRKSESTYEELEKTLDRYMEKFREANSDVQFVYLVTSGAHNISVSESFPVDVLNNLKRVEEKDITVVDWGKLVADIIRGEITVPGGTQSYNNYTFVHNRAETDGFHPNQLTGYITALMVYCAITGESAVGQSYDFWDDAQFDPEEYYAYAYPCGPSNYQDIFASKEDMQGIQQLIDRYLSEKAYMDYHFE